MTFKKHNHHYVPQFWQRGFSDPNGKLFGRTGTTIKQVSSKKTMQGDWLYTVFDNQWNPSDSLENALSVLEASAAALFRRIGAQGSATMAADRDALCSTLALQACRHPDIMGQGHRRGKSFGELLASAHGLTLSDFTKEMANYGVSPSDALQLYNIMIAKTPEQLAQELNELHRLSPQDPQLPEQDALRALPIICAQLQKMELTLLDAPPDKEFVLGDTPIPGQNLSDGFSVPISSSVAVLLQPATAPQATMARRTATKTDVDAINKTQWDNSLHVVVASSKAVLEGL